MQQNSGLATRPISPTSYKKQGSATSNLKEVPKDSSIVSPSEIKGRSFTRELDEYYCDFSLAPDDFMKAVLTSQIDATVYLLEMGPEEKQTRPELNMFESVEELYEYVEENSALEGEDEQDRMVRIGQEGQIQVTVQTMLGKKEKKRTFSLKTNKVEANKTTYLENVVKKVSKTMTEIKKELNILRRNQNEILQVNSDLRTRLALIGNRLPFIPDPKDPHYSKFKLAGGHITKMGESSTYYSLVGSQHLPSSGTVYFNIRIVSSPSRNIMVGVGSKFTRGITNVYSHQDFAGFYAYGSGFVWEGGNQRELDLRHFPIERGATLTTFVDMTHGFVAWEICGVRAAYAVLPSQLRAKMLFPMVLMITGNDTIELDL